jgi:hypothetical protein
MIRQATNFFAGSTNLLLNKKKCDCPLTPHAVVAQPQMLKRSRTVSLLRYLLKREEAIALIKEITEEKCTNLVGHDIILMSPNADNPLSLGYQLHIKTVLDNASYQCLELLVQMRGYVLNHDAEKQLIIIYKPKIPIKLDETGIM